MTDEPPEPPLVPWWCVAGTIVVLVDARDEKQAQTRASEQVRKARHPILPANFEVRPATDADVALFELIKAEEAAGIEEARSDGERREIVISEDQLGLSL